MLLFYCELLLAPAQNSSWMISLCLLSWEKGLLIRMFSALPSIPYFRAMPWRQVTELTIQLIAMING
jgi:hypothetical protein